MYDSTLCKYLLSLLTLFPHKPLDIREVEAHLITLGIREYDHFHILDNLLLLVKLGSVKYIGYKYTL